MYLDEMNLGALDITTGEGVQNITDQWLASGGTVKPPTPGVPSSSAGKPGVVSTVGIVPGSEGTTGDTYVPTDGTPAPGDDISKTDIPSVPTARKWYKSPLFITACVVVGLTIAGAVYATRHSRA